MKKREGRWVDVKEGDYVIDKDGHTWKVLKWDHVQATLKDRDGKTAKAKPRPYSEVTYLTRTMKDAVLVVERMLGGVVIEERNTSEDTRQ